ncbi:lymphocyte antigen 6D [Pseudoliparis swirei]|uniref:lymphocyte antigen 6D n=1 Tax=Pseudoliparis swirei TaxID=2059687 RepID=UPI0024BD6B28|nr:lymphocyte antigen 6D [Pseudoliparis swirei]
MHLYGALILFVTVSAACGLSCYVCAGKTCTLKRTCPTGYDRCSTFTVKDVVTKTCMNSKTCVKPMKCCSTDLCNSAIPTGSSVLLLLASSAIITVFL